jgi:multidrug efflux system outer membrane protein
VLRALEETETAVSSYDRAHERVGILNQAVMSSQKALDLAQQRFEAGLTDFLQVLDAQRTLLDAENQFTGAQVQAGTALVALYKAAGGTWSVRD